MQDYTSEENRFLNPIDSKKVKKIKKQAFKQQLLTAWKPKPTLKCAIIFYFIIAIIFLAIGITIIIFSNRLNDISIRYDNIENCKINSKCQITLKIPKTLKSPIFVYYYISDFYQNNRLYIKSIITKQLRGNKISSAEEDNCSDAKYNKDFAFAKKSVSGDPLQKDEIAHPCGLAARSYFNDTFILKNDKNENIQIKDDKISWDDDVDYKFKNYDLKKQWIDVESERFINWMKIASFRNFRKTWGRIENDLEEGDYVVEVHNLWDSSVFGGKKRFGLAQSNEFGSKNLFLGYSYVFFGCLSFLFAIGFLVRKIQRPKGVLDNKIKSVRES